MRRDLSSTNIEEFYEEIKDKYDISFEECKLVCIAPFNMIKEVMNNSIFKNIRLKYFGTFTVSKSRLKYNLKGLEEQYKNNLVSEERYLKRKKELENGL